MAEPDSARLRRNMSALVDLAKSQFREEKLAGNVAGQRAHDETRTPASLTELRHGRVVQH